MIALTSLFYLKTKKKGIKKAKITITAAVVLFEYKKANKDYWDRLKHHQQLVNKALLIAEVVCTKNTLYSIMKNKEVGGKQHCLCNEWFTKDRVCIAKPISFPKANCTLV